MLTDGEQEAFRNIQIETCAEDPRIFQSVKRSTEFLLDAPEDTILLAPFIIDAYEILESYGINNEKDAEDVLNSFFKRLVKERTHDK